MSGSLQVANVKSGHGIFLKSIRRVGERLRFEKSLTQEWLGEVPWWALCSCQAAIEMAPSGVKFRDPSG